MSALVEVPAIRFKSTRIVYAANYAGIGGRCDVFFQGMITMSTEGMLVISGYVTGA